MKNPIIPKNPELEISVLSTVLDNPGKDLCRELSDELFTFPCSKIFPAIQALDHSKALSFLNLEQQLRNAGLLESIGGNGKLKGLLGDGEIRMPGADYEFAVGELRGLADRRLDCEVGEKLTSAAKDGTRDSYREDAIEALKNAGSLSRFHEVISTAALTGDDFMNREFPRRPKILGDWFCRGDLGFVFAPRGVGKTWFVHSLIAALTSGNDLQDWQVQKPVKVCLLDGEMPPDDVQSRLRGLGVNPQNLEVISHQVVYDVSEKSIQLADPEHRRSLLDFCIDKSVEVLVIDNLSSVSHISENDNDEWTALGDWLLEFRRVGVSVVVVHHAGRNGQMRGASRREDPAFWIIGLQDSKDRHATTEGARFVSPFTKPSRNTSSSPEPIDWHITPSETGGFEIETTAATNTELVYQLIRDGLDKCSDIAAELDISRGTVSKQANKLESEGRITITGKGNTARYVAN